MNSILCHLVMVEFNTYSNTVTFRHAEKDGEFKRK